MAVNYIIKEKTIKNFKRLLIELVAVFAAILLVACGAKSDNGTYVFEPSKEEAVKMLPEELQGLSGDGFNVKISIAIQGDKDEYKSETEFGGNKKESKYEYKVDQKSKTMKYEAQGVKVELSYEISNDVLTIKKVKNSVVNGNDFFRDYLKIAKFKKVK